MYLFVDASQHPQTRVAVTGILLPDNTYVLKHFSNVTNTQAEILGVIDAINYIQQHVSPQPLVIIYTDCQTVVDLPFRRNKLVKIKPEYVSLFNAIDTCHSPIKFVHIQGHKKKSEKGSMDILFSSLDKMVRKELRKLIQ